MVVRCSSGSEPVEEAVAGPEQLVRGDRALGRAHADALAVLHLQRRAVFEYPCAEAGQCLGFAEQQVERVHMAAAHVQQGAAVGVRADDLAHLGTVQVTDLMGRAERPEFLFPGLQGLRLACVEAHVAVAVAEVGVDGVLLDTALDDVGAEVADLEDRPQAVLADILADLLQVVADAGHDLPAVAPGTAEAEVAGLQHDDVGDAVLGQLKRGVDPGEAAADHHHVGVQVGFQGGRTIRTSWSPCSRSASRC